MILSHLTSLASHLQQHSNYQWFPEDTMSPSLCARCSLGLACLFSLFWFGELLVKLQCKDLFQDLATVPAHPLYLPELFLLDVTPGPSIHSLFCNYLFICLSFTSDVIILCQELIPQQAIARSLKTDGFHASSVTNTLMPGEMG